MLVGAGTANTGGGGGGGIESIWLWLLVGLAMVILKFPSNLYPSIYTTGSP